MDLNAFVCNLHNGSWSFKTSIVDVDADLEGAECDEPKLHSSLSAFLEEESLTGAMHCLLSTQRVVADGCDVEGIQWLPDGVYAVLTIHFAGSTAAAVSGQERLPKPGEFNLRGSAAQLAEFVHGCGGLLTIQTAGGTNIAWRLYLRASALEVEKFDFEDTLASETILLVEDEGFVRGVTREVLELSGYRVLEASNAQAGLELFTKNMGNVDLLLTDVVMPGMNGPELVQRLTTVAPSLRVLFMSGYTDNEVLRRGLGDPNIAYLQKPFTLEALARKVREVLDSAPSLLLPLPQGLGRPSFTADSRGQ